MMRFLGTGSKRESSATIPAPLLIIAALACAAAKPALADEQSDKSKFTNSARRTIQPAELETQTGESFNGAPTPGIPRGDLVLCPPDTLFSQPPTLGEGFSAGVSESGAGIARADRFSGVSGPITAIRWWGFELDFVPPGTFLLCQEPVPTFDIIIYEDYGSAPGPVACFYSLTATRTPSGLFYGGEDNPLELIQYDVTLPTSCFKVRGFLSIIGGGDSECWHYWMSSSDGNGASYCDGCQLASEYDLSFCLIGTPGEFTGACCDELAATCNDNVAVADCVADYQRFAPGATCASLMPKCGELKGACCFNDSRPCAVIAQNFCELVGGAWAGPATTCDTCPATGPCCQGATSCAITTEAECLAEGHSWLGSDAECDMCPPLPTCDETGTLFGQSPFDPIDEIGATSSESGSGFRVHDNFTGVAGPIQSLKWWGFDLRPVGNGFVECVESFNSFVVTFYNDAGGSPGAIVHSETVTATRSPTGIRYNGAELNEYRATLQTPQVLTHGWLSIVGQGDANCWFLWIHSPDGDNVAYCSGCIPEQQSSNYAFCIEGPAGGVSGACCTQSTGVCAEEVDIANCLGANQRFAPNAACDAFNPPCGVVIGACCRPFDTCSTITNLECAALGGNWLGAETLCNQCPCTAFCPPDGYSEPEPACGEGFVDTTNGGCNVSPPVFTPISISQSVCGVMGHYSNAEGNEVHDEDWYQLDVIATIGVFWTIVAEGPAEGWIIRADGGCPGTIVDHIVSDPCESITLTAFADTPGTYWLVVSGRGQNDASGCPLRYVATVESPFGCTPGDVNLDTHIDGRDLALFVSCMLTGSAPGGSCPCADMDFSNNVNMDDVEPFVTALLGDQ